VRASNEPQGRLRVATDGAQSVVTTLYSRAPHRFLVPVPRGPVVSAYVTSLGGGLVQGDDIALEVDVEPGAALVVASQGSTKVYKGSLTQQSLTARVSAGAALVWVPEPVTCFAGARYRQAQALHLEASASLLYLDWLTSGRMARGERWQAEAYESRTQIFVGGQLVAHDALSLGGDTAARRMGRVNALASVFVLGPRMQLLALALAREQRDVTRRPDLLCAVGALPGGVVWRVAGETIERVREHIAVAIKVLAPSLGCDIWARRA
jgi:urease accessory protein